MKINKALRELMRDTKTPQSRVAESIGTRQSTISTRLSNNDMLVSSALDFLEVMNYELVIQPKKQGRRTEGQILITQEDVE